MAVAPEGSGTATGGHGDLGPHTRAKLRATLTGSIFAMSVLAYLGDHETTLTKAVLTVVGTGLVIFFGEAYAGLFSMALASVRALPAAEVRHELSACSMAAAPVSSRAPSSWSPTSSEPPCRPPSTSPCGWGS